MSFADRRDAGRRLAEHLGGLRAERPVVLALPRGGVPVAAEVADRLDAPLDVLVVRKLGCPWQPELGVGGIGEGGVRVLNRDLMAQLGLAEADLEDVAERERAELDRRLRAYRGDRAPAPVEGRTAVVIDDGLATGFTARTAIEVVRRRGARRVVLAVPVAPREPVEQLRGVADEVVCLRTPDEFYAIGAWYRDFRQTTDDEVRILLARASRAGGERAPGADDGQRAPGAGDGKGASAAADGAGAVHEVEIPAGALRLPGTLAVPPEASAVVAFAHGSGSSRLSPRNAAVAARLRDAGLATLLFDLLGPDEADDRAKVFDVPLLAGRLLHATDWLRRHPGVRHLPVGYFGASTGSAAALAAAAERGDDVAAIVSRGGRPDLAGPALARVTAPTLLVVGALDEAVLQLNRQAAELLRCEHHVEVVGGAGHLFEEPGALDRVAALARQWFLAHLAPGHAAGAHGGHARGAGSPRAGGTGQGG